MIRTHTIADTASIRDAMNLIEQAPAKICIVTDEGGVLQRTLTDGDIRRALLSGDSLDMLITHMSGTPKTPVIAPVDASRDVLKALLHTEQVRAIVLVDGENRPVGLVDKNQFENLVLLSPPHMGETEATFVAQAFSENWVAPAGPNIAAFEAVLAKTTGRKHALALSSGTAALHLALRVLNVKPHDRVYVSNLTFIASLQPVYYEQAVPVLIDSEPDTWNMSPLALKRRLEKDAAANTLPTAIIVVHIYGQSANIAALCALADLYGIPVIEDAAESLGATYQNMPSGSHGVLAAYSFNGNKIITTAGGGALVSDDAALIARAQMLSTQGRDPAEHYQHSTVAYNYRMSNILAGIGRGQVAILPERVAARREVFQRYQNGFADIAGLSFQADSAGSKGSRWLTVLNLDPDHIDIHPYQLIRRLRSQNIEARAGWKPMNMQPLCADLDFEPHSAKETVSSALFLRTICLPSGSSMLPDIQDRVINSIRSILKGS